MADVSSVEPSSTTIMVRPSGCNASRTLATALPWLYVGVTTMKRGVGIESGVLDIDGEFTCCPVRRYAKGYGDCLTHALGLMV